jgi:hypothetical protein
MTEKSKSIPDEFTKVIKDFVNDIRITFPEYSGFIDKWWVTSEDNEKSLTYIFDFCKKKFPPRFFDILYQNDEIFKEDSEIDTEFLPKIHFKNLWQCDISQKTRDTIWKYLQLIMFSIVATLDNKDAFGDTAKMFEAINESEFKDKLEETMKQMQGIFDFSSNFTEGSEPLGEGFSMPDPTQLHEHITGMLGGKLGQLAREIAEETAANLDIDFDEATDMKDVFQKLVKNPNKLMGLVKTVGDKLDTKIKSGDLKESELIAEATEMMNKMKNMPGMGNIQSLLSKMGLSGMAGMAGMGGGAKVNTAAMEANLNQKMKMAKTKERIKAKAEANAKARLEQQILEQQRQLLQSQQSVVSEEELIKIFSSGEAVERTPRGAKPSNKKKKGKK